MQPQRSLPPYVLIILTPARNEEASSRKDYRFSIATNQTHFAGFGNGLIVNAVSNRLFTASRIRGIILSKIPLANGWNFFRVQPGAEFLTAKATALTGLARKRGFKRPWSTMSWETGTSIVFHGMAEFSF